MMRRARRSNAPEVEAGVEDLAHDGRGVARVDGRAVFVAGALPGERVRLKITGRRQGVEEGELLEVLQASPQRVEPACPHFGICGGCALQHLAPEAQVAFKQAQLLQGLERIGGVRPGAVLPPLTGPTWRYRRRARLGVRYVAKKGRVLVGFRERSAPYVADLAECRILAGTVSELLPALAELVGELSISTQLPQIEVAIADATTALVLRVLAEPNANDLARLRAFEATHAVSLYLQSGGPESARPLTPNAVPPSYALPAFGLEFRFQPTDFVQVNSELNQRMVARAVELLDLRTTHSVLDLFCGLGNFSLPLATRVARVVGVEGDPALIERARANATFNELANVEYHVANLFEGLADDGWAGEGYDRVLLDPPRAGAREVLPLVAASGAGRVVYISCHPGSLARDAGLLVREHGFRLAAAGVMDMFPHTAHVEALAVFER
jgi:23S rRNA (uracil1939-C5)-methyltransferase